MFILKVYNICDTQHINVCQKHAILFVETDYPYKPLAYYRYIDDNFIIWSHGLDLLHNFINSINKQHSNIIFTSNISTTSVNFLDVTIVLHGGHISIKTYTHFFHTTVSTQDILNNLLSTVNFYVTNAFVLMTKIFSTMPPHFLNTFYLDNTPSLTSFIISTKLNRSTDTNYSPTPPNSNTAIFA